MPYLKKYKKPQSQKPKDEKDDIYHSRKWQLLRQNYLQHHPLCEICEAEGKSTLAQDVHHKDSFNHYYGDERILKAFDYDNLMSLCRYHHCELHKGNKTTYGFNMDEYLAQHQDEINLLKEV